MSGRYLEVALPPPVARQLTYRLPDELDPGIGTGALVLVPVGRRLLTGVILGPAAPPDGTESLREEQIRPVAEVLDDQALSPELVELCRWTAGYYFAPLGSVLMAALPPGLHQASGRSVRWCEGAALPAEASPAETRIAAALQGRGALTVKVLRQRVGGDGLEGGLRRLAATRCLETRLGLSGPRVRQRRELRLRVADQGRVESGVAELESRAPRQAGCLRYLLARPEGSSRRELVAAGFAAGVLTALCDRGLLERFDGTTSRDPLAHLRSAPPDTLTPTADQRRVIDDLTAALETASFFPALLHGVTGSGKTLVYIDLTARALALGRGTIVLVPEIALAWQMVRRFHAHFGEQVAVLHSQLSTGERYDTWLRLRRGEQRIVIGARSAVLAPVQDLGLLIVDEEHDASYKQEDLDSHHPFAYNARDLALVRGQRRQALVLLGSATPSLESYWNARTGKYHLFALPRRVDDRPLARVSVVDLRREPGHRKKRVIFSRTLRLKMRERLERGEQIVLLQNRRGFAPFILCGACGEAVQCGRCRVSTTYHRGPQPEMRCHYCDYRAPVPAVCPACGGTELRFEGIGTQKVETALEEQFPGVRVIRMDVDTTGWKGAHDELVERFRQRQADVLLGTQMVAKGLDFPEVTLVGVISADTGMHLPDFRAAERSFQLLTQVAGRSGRGASPGEVVIQTSLPDDPVLQTAAAQDYAAFAERELEERRPAGFPPFGRLVVFRWRGRKESAVIASAERGAAGLRSFCEGDQTLLGPAAAPLALLRGEHRWQALLRGGSPPRLHAVTAAALTGLRAACDGGVSLTVNVDPLTMM